MQIKVPTREGRSRRRDLQEPDGEVYSLQTLRGDGNGRFLAPMTLPLGINAQNLRAADLDGDKLPELIADGFEGGNLEVFHNLGAPCFAPAQRLATGRKIESVGVRRLQPRRETRPGLEQRHRARLRGRRDEVGAHEP